MSQDIYILDEQDILVKEIRTMFSKENKIKVKKVKTDEVDNMLKDIPAIIIINDDGVNGATIELCKEIREDEDNSITPILVISSKEEYNHKMEILKNNVEYFIEKSEGPEFIYLAIKNIARLMEANRTVSPLTRLPGNVQIHAELKKRLIRKKEFSVLYFDLDNFKAYNDVYGFLKGDEVIKLAARIITENVHQVVDNDTFVGHIGGDDFVAILDGTADIENVCQNVIAQFDAEISKYFTEEDLGNGFIKVQNRKRKS